MKKRIHVNQHVIKRNTKTGEREPVITCKTYKENKYGHQVIIKDDEREYDEDKDEYEPLVPFIMCKFNEYIDELNKLKFK